MKTKNGNLQSVLSLKVGAKEVVLTQLFLKRGIRMQSKYSKLWMVFVSAVVVLPGVPVYAHHAFAAEYDGRQRVTITGTLTGFDWYNPHAWLHVDVKDADGKVENWAVEFGSPNALYRRGFRKTDFPAGTEVVIEGYRAKNGSNNLNARSVKLPDGRNLFAGSSAPDAPQ
jgi:Family of unknown function (DUF6152)